MVRKLSGHKLPIYLRKMEHTDTDLIIKWRNSDQVRPYFIYQEPFTREGHKKWTEQMIDTGLGYQFMICSTNTDEPIGSTYLRDYDSKHNHIEYGLFIGESTLKGQGIGAISTMLTVQFAFEHLHVHRIHSQVLAMNHASNQMVHTLGFTHEGTLREHVYVNGDFQDVLLYSLLESELNKVDGYQEES